MKFLVVIMVLFMGMTSAHAFQETEVPVITSPAEERRPESQREKVEMNLPDETGAINPSKGTSIYVPGLGKLGTLPDINFGLELLYSGDGNESTNERSDEDITIKGRLKHNF